MLTKNLSQRYLYLLCVSEKTSPFLYLWQLSQTSSNFVNSWQEYAPGNLKQAHTQHTTSEFYMFVLYLVKTDNEFCGIQYTIKYTRQSISLPQACGHRVVLTW